MGVEPPGSALRVKEFREEVRQKLKQELKKQVRAFVVRRNKQKAKINWQFTRKKAHEVFGMKKLNG